jgi:hypothetical protein
MPDNDTANDTEMTEEQKIHLEKALKDWAEEQMKDASELCTKIMERTKQHIFEFRNAPGPIDIVEFLSTYRMKIIYQIQYILEASNSLEKNIVEESRGS